MAWIIRFSSRADENLAALPRPQQAAIFDAIESRLRHQPDVETRNRKRMKPDKPGFIAPWELRLGELRVYYDLQPGAPVVLIVAIGVKVRNCYRIGDWEYEA